MVFFISGGYWLDFSFGEKHFHFSHWDLFFTRWAEGELSNEKMETRSNPTLASLLILYKILYKILKASPFSFLLSTDLKMLLMLFSVQRMSTNRTHKTYFLISLLWFKLVYLFITSSISMQQIVFQHICQNFSWIPTLFSYPQVFIYIRHMYEECFPVFNLMMTGLWLLFSLFSLFHTQNYLFLSRD